MYNAYERLPDEVKRRIARLKVKHQESHTAQGIPRPGYRDIATTAGIAIPTAEHRGMSAAIVAGAANNQLATPDDGARIAARGILYAPDYVINAGGIINVVAEYLGGRGGGHQVAGDAASVAQAIARIEGRLADIFAEADRSGRPTDAVADAMARKLIGRG